ncbi:hypothetical protein LQZ18_00560 [Lachnospiraceae bacterium ZAX-1]
MKNENKNEDKKEKEYRVISLKAEYPGFVGTEKWAVVSELPESVLLGKFEELKTYCPFIIFSHSQWEAIREYRQNDGKFKKRDSLYHDFFGYEEGITEFFSDVKENPVVDEVVAKTEAQRLHRAMNQLTLIQQKRLSLYYFEGLSEYEIADLEDTTRQAVHESLESAIKKLKKFF